VSCSLNHTRVHAQRASPVNNTGVMSNSYAYCSLGQRVQRLPQRHVLHGLVQGERHVPAITREHSRIWPSSMHSLHDETHGLSSSVGEDGHNAHDVGVRQQLQRLQLPPQHAVHVLVKSLDSGIFALVLDLEHTA
jgi:hypothetical protein